MTRRIDKPDLAFGVLITALGAFLAITGQSINSPRAWGPALVPMIVAGGLMLLGALTAFSAWRTPRAQDGAAPENDWLSFLFVLAAPVAFGAISDPLGFPLAGDDKYGDFAWNRSVARQGLHRMFLHAHRIEFLHPVSGARMTIESPLPPDLANFLARLDQPHEAALDG